MRSNWFIGLLGVLGWDRIIIVGLLFALAAPARYAGALAQKALAGRSDPGDRQQGPPRPNPLLTTFLLHGEVLDEAGRPLKGVEIHITAGRQKGLGPLQRSSETFTRRVDGIFRIELKDYSDVLLEFSREGYYAATRFYRALSDEELTALLGGQGLPKELKGTKEIAIRVVLEKKGRLTKLDERQVVLVVTSKGPDKGLQLSLPTAARGTGPGAGLKNGAGGRRSRLSLEVARTAGGSIKTMPVPWPNEPDETTVVPAGLKLKLQGTPGDGLRRFPPSGDTPAPRQMKTAPSAGYQPELTPSPEELRQIRVLQTPVYFYLRVGGFYGRGSFSRFNLAEDGSRLEAFLLLEIQPDGTRNLETGE